MATMYLSRSSQPLQPPNCPQLRHIPVKRIAPCPPSDQVIAEAKRSRMLHTPSAVSRRPVQLTVRNPQYNTENGSSASAVTWSSRNCFQTYCNLGSPITISVAPISKELNYDPINDHNVTRISMSRAASGLTDMRKSKCCPLRMSSPGCYTPPYDISASTQIGKAEGNKPRRRPLSHKLKRRSSVSKKIKANADVGYFDAMKNAAHGRIKTVNECLPQNNVPQPELNALSVYHSFLKRREEAMSNEQASEVRTSTTTRASRTSVSTKITEVSVRYSSNFSPPLTSTPQKLRPSCNEVKSKSSTEFKVPFPPPSKKGRTLFEFLRALEDERRLGNSHVMLPLTELTNMMRDLQKKQRTQGNAENSGCFGSIGTTASNNNNDDLNEKMNSFVISKPALPGMYPIGAPRSASSPVSCSRKRVAADDRTSGRVARNTKRRVTATNESASSNNESAFSMGLTGGAADVWRPW